MKQLKRFGCCLLAAVMVLSCLAVLPTRASAATFGDCGEGLTWSLDDSGTLTISGSGAMDNFDEDTQPWKDVRESILKVVLESEVTTIGAYAFYNCTALTDVEFSQDDDFQGGVIISSESMILAGVQSIGMCAFNNCSALEEISIPDSVTTIGEAAFCDCSSLTSMTLPEYLTAIDWSVFLGCSKMESIHIPVTVTNIGGYAFQDCTSLTDVYYAGTSGQWEQIEINDSISDANEALINATKHFTDGDQSGDTPPATPAIVDSGICGENLTWSLDEAGTLTISGTGTMQGYDNSQYLPPWEDHRLNITSVVIENTVTSVGDYAFYQHTNLSSVSLSEGLTSIGDSAFASCFALTGIKIPASVTSINLSAFDGCEALANITVTDGGTAYSSDAKGVLFNKAKTNLYLAPKGITGSYEIPAGVTTIFASAFEGCDALTAVTIPDSVTSVRSYAFAGCDELTSVDVPDSVTFMGAGVFSYCPKLTRGTIPAGITSVPYSTFTGCTSLKRVSIPASVTTIEGYAFDGCTVLEDVHFGGREAQWDAITVEDGNEPLNSVGVTFAGASQPEGPSIVAAGECGENVNWFLDSDGLLTIAGTGAMASDPKFGPPWMEYDYSKVVIEEGVTTICYDAFSNNNSLTSVRIPETVTLIEPYAFSKCAGLTEITIPASVTEIGHWAFEGCTGLTEVTIPANVRTFGQNVFDCCTKLEEATFESGVQSTGVQMFAECTKLKTVNIPSTIVLIHDAAFRDCIALTDVYYDGLKAQWEQITVNNGNEPLKNANIHFVASAPNGWYQVDDIWYYGKDGKNVTGWLPLGSDWYYLDPEDDGAMVTDFFIINGAFNKFSASGVWQGLMTGPNKLGQTWYFMDQNGVMQRGWQQYEGNWYYMDEACVMLFGEQMIEGKYHRFSNTGVWLGEFVKVIDSGTCGPNVNWSFDSNGVLIITGTGATDNANLPWNEYKNDIVKVVVETGVTAIGTCAFSGCENLTEATLADSVVRIESDAFKDCANLETIKFGNKIEYIGLGAFDRCDSLEVTNYGNLVYLGNADNPYAAVISIADIDMTECTIAQQTKVIAEHIFGATELLTDVYYDGTEEQWKTVSVCNMNDYLFVATIHFTEIVPNGWYQVGGTWYYGNGGKNATGWLQDGAWYYMDETGAMVTGEHLADGGWSRFSASGAWIGYITGWYYAEGNWYYLNSVGVAQTGWIQDGAWYYMDETGAMVTGEHTIGGVLHNFNASGVWLGEVQVVKKNGWALEDGAWYYYKNDVKQTGWILDGSWYYMDDDGAMVTGEVTIDGRLNVFSASGVWQGYKSGWVLDDGDWYYYTSGKPMTGWLQQGSIWYYMDESGVMVTGNTVIDGVLNRFNASGVWLGY